MFDSFGLGSFGLLLGLGSGLVNSLDLCHGLGLGVSVEFRLEFGL